MPFVDIQQHGQVAEVLKRWMQHCGGSGNSAKCESSLPSKHDSISAVSTATPSPDSSFDEASSLCDADPTRRAEHDFEAQSFGVKTKPSSTFGEFHDEEDERRAFPRTSSEVSEFWLSMQGKLDEEAEGLQFEEETCSMSASTNYSTDYDFRPRTPTVFNEVVTHGAAVIHESELVRRNSELEDRVAELERKLLELAEQQGAA